MTIAPFRNLPVSTPTPYPIPHDLEARSLTGTLPLRTFHPNGFFGTVQVDDQSARVAALACFEGKLLPASLVGYDTSVSATLAHLWQSKTVPFQPKTGVTWQGPLALSRRPRPYKQFSTRLSGTNQVHVIALSLDAHIGEGLLVPPPMARPDEKESAAWQTDVAATVAQHTYPRWWPTLCAGQLGRGRATPARFSRESLRHVRHLAAPSRFRAS